MHRFYLPPEQCQEPSLLLSEREAHHALHVLRLRPGDRVSVLDGAGGVYSCDVVKSGASQLQLAVVQKQAVPAPSCQVTLLQALPKGKIIEDIVQKATELGVSRVVPLLSDRTATRLDSDGAAQKAGKWQQLAIESIKQCGSPWLPAIEPAVALREFLARREVFELPLIASLQPGSRPAREYFRAFQTRNGRLPRSVAAWIGPEGDFSDLELADIVAQGAREITLGPLVLRSETAAICCLSILNYELQSGPVVSPPAP